MPNFNVKLDLSKLNKVAVTEIQGRNGKVKCVAIPVEDNGVFISDRTGSIYLDLYAIETRSEKYGQSHFLKPRVGGERWKAMSEEERNNIAICGSLSPVAYSAENAQPQRYSTSNSGYQPNTSQSSGNFGGYTSNNDPLPF